MKQYGLLGEKLSHSYSPRLHALLADYRYELWETPPDGLDAFMRAKDFDGLNVTIPYKRAMLPYLDEVSDTARRVGCVNTVVKCADGTLFGDNTDVYGFEAMAARAGVDFAGQKTLVLGSGGASLTVCHAVRAAGGAPVVVSRGGETTYDDVEKHADAAFVVNATPVGMYPHTDASPLDLTRLDGLKGVLDVIYNPLRSRLMQQAEGLGLPRASGLRMLVYQAARACELFTGEPVQASRMQEAEKALRASATNLVLVGMPGCGKSTVGRRLAARLKLPYVDIDAEIERAAGASVEHIFQAEGESGFRAREREQLARFGREGGRVLATGGGAVKDAINREHMRLNGVVVRLERKLDRLATGGRPLSTGREALQALWRERAPLYDACADVTIENNGTLAQCVRKVEEAYYEALCH